MKLKYQVLSPDGFTIERENPYYKSIEKAQEAFINWSKRFEFQGYYSSNNGRIPLDELESNCTIKKIINKSHG